jgi:hypothetical protein
MSCGKSSCCGRDAGIPLGTQPAGKFSCCELGRFWPRHGIPLRNRAKFIPVVRITIGNGIDNTTIIFDLLPDTVSPASGFTGYCGWRRRNSSMCRDKKLTAH